MARLFKIFNLCVLLVASLFIAVSVHADPPECSGYKGLIDPDPFVFTKVGSEYHVYLGVDSSMEFDGIDIFPADNSQKCSKVDGVHKCTFTGFIDQSVTQADIHTLIVVDFTNDTGGGKYCVVAWAKGYYNRTDDPVLAHSNSFEHIPDGVDNDGDGLINEVDSTPDGDEDIEPPKDEDPLDGDIEPPKDEDPSMQKSNDADDKTPAEDSLAEEGLFESPFGEEADMDALAANSELLGASNTSGGGSCSLSPSGKINSGAFLILILLASLFAFADIKLRRK